MIDMKKNETHQELIIKSSFPASQVPVEDSDLRGLVDMLLVAMALLAQACCFL